MYKKLVPVLIIMLVVSSLAVYGCKGRAEKTQEEMAMDTQGLTSIEEPSVASISEPAQTVATETIPPTASPALTPKPTMVMQEAERSKDIQIALKNAGFYTGSIDGKVGPKTKKAIEEFQKAKGLKVDGKVGPKTWAELEKYLTPR